MKLFYDKRRSDPIYYVQQGYRNAEGKPTTRNVKILGRHSELLKITDDPVTYCRREVAKLNEEYNAGRASIQLTVDYKEKVDETADDFSKADLMNVGYFYLQTVYQKLELKEFFEKITADRKITYDCNDINRFLTYARILDPRSKYGTFDHLDAYFEKPAFDYQHILRFMDILIANSDSYLDWLYKKSNNVIPRDTSVIYYDCTNYYFETEQPDEEVVDEVTGEILSSGLRQYGVSKEHRPNPIVEMGLMMDKRGIPISMCVHPGNTSEQVTAVPLEKEVLSSLDGAEFIYCADTGLGSYNIRKFNSMGGRSFIITQSIKKLSNVLKQAIFNDYDYKLLSTDAPVTIEEMKTFDRFDPNYKSLYNDFAYKVILADKAVDLGLYDYVTLKNNQTRRVKATGMIPQNIIITFSRKMMEYQRAIRERQIERAKRLAESKDPEEVKKGPNDVRRFLKRNVKTEDGKKAEVTYELDEAKIEEEKKYDGYYAVATNLKNDRAKDILAIIHKRYQIEDCFRIMKTNFNARPVFHSKEDWIKAHFLICYTALLVYRLLECKLDDIEAHVTTDNLIRTLKNMNVTDEGVYYRAAYKGSKALTALTTMENLGLDMKRYKTSDLKKKIKKLLK
jgi:transposase